MPDDAKLCWITPGHRWGLMGYAAPDGPRPDFDDLLGVAPEIVAAFDAAPVPVERRRCETAGHGESLPWDDREEVCYVARCIHDFTPYGVQPCRFVSVFEVPASPSDPTSETTT